MRSWTLRTAGVPQNRSLRSHHAAFELRLNRRHHTFKACAYNQRHAELRPVGHLVTRLGRPGHEGCSAEENAVGRRSVDIGERVDDRPLNNWTVVTEAR